MKTDSEWKLLDKILLSAVFGICAGIILASFDYASPAILYGIAGLAFLISIIFLIFKNFKFATVSVFLFGALLGIGRFQIAEWHSGDPELKNLVGQKITFNGLIVDEPNKGDAGTKLTVLVLNEKKEKTKILITLNGSAPYKYGDTASFLGTLKLPENFAGTTGKPFDYVNYLRKDGIFYVMDNPQNKSLAEGGGSAIKRKLFALKEKLVGVINKNIPAPESILMNGLILGERSSFSPELKQQFIDTGTVHIIAISGYNITLVAEVVMKMFGFLPILFAGLLGVISIFLFIILTGGAQTAIRAGIMATVALFAKAGARNYDIGRALIFTALVMVFINPYILAFDVSFQLSFIATFAIIFFYPKIEKHFLWIKWKALRDIVALTFSAYVFVMPFILYKMGNFSLVALPANIAILLIIPQTMMIGFLTAFSGFVSSALAMLGGKISYFLLHYELLAVNFFANLSFASFSVPDFPLSVTIAAYAIFMYILFSKKKADKEILKYEIGKSKNKSFGLAFMLSPFILVALTAGFIYLPRYQTEVKQTAELHKLLVGESEGTQKANVIDAIKEIPPFIADLRTKVSDCHVNGALPDHECSLGAIFPDAGLDRVCVSGYTKTVRNVPLSLKKKVYAAYGIQYPQPTGSYELDHLIPLAIGGSNDIANLFPESASPKPGFHEKDIVEVYLQEEICAGRALQALAQKQISENWLAIYENLQPDTISRLKNRFSN